jgi:hypothetical protein
VENKFSYGSCQTCSVSSGICICSAGLAEACTSGVLECVIAGMSPNSINGCSEIDFFGCDNLATCTCCSSIWHQVLCVLSFCSPVPQSSVTKQSTATVGAAPASTKTYSTTSTPGSGSSSASTSGTSKSSAARFTRLGRVQGGGFVLVMLLASISA